MPTRFLVTHIVDDPYKSGYKEYLIVNGEVFYRDIEKTFQNDPDYGMEYATVRRCRLKDIPTVSPDAGTIVTRWYLYELGEVSGGDIPSAYTERVATIFFKIDKRKMGKISVVE